MPRKAAKPINSQIALGSPGLVILRFALIASLMTAMLAAGAWAQSLNTANTLKLDDPAARPAATLDQIAWLAGEWKGKAFGGDVEEIWSEASAGTMMGMFKLINDNKPTLYEFELIVEEKGSLSVQLKHFSPDLKGWEEKDAFVSFKLVKLKKNEIYFEGLTYRLDGPDQLTVYVAIGSEGEVTEERLVFHRGK